ncbi:hypothetical protein AAM22_gp67 [Pantoea phage vB_PagM_AAM22]|nr:hypothetical protein AAM22_gp67 [Pantoea phage vB_PagM_AAM22]
MSDTVKKLIADLKTGETIVLRDEVYGPSYTLVRKIEWMTFAPIVTINGEMCFRKEDWVEVAG